MLLVSSLGFTLGFFRLYNKNLMREIIWKIFPKSLKCYKKNNQALLINQEPLSIGEHFEISSIKVFFNQILLKTLLSLSLRYSSFDCEYKKYNDFDEFLFTEEQFVMVLEKTDIEDYDSCKS